MKVPFGEGKKKRKKRMRLAVVAFHKRMVSSPPYKEDASLLQAFDPALRGGETTLWRAKRGAKIPPPCLLIYYQL